MNATTKLIWKGVDNPTFEHCTVEYTSEHILVQSNIEGLVNNVFTIVEYEIELNTTWTVSAVYIKVNTTEKVQFIKLIQNKPGEWTDATLRVLPELNGCIDIDISLTPFTNTLPVKRLAFKPGESRVFKMVYFDLPSFEIKAAPQRYTCLRNNQFKFEGLDIGYTNEITFTPNGFVWFYPNLFDLMLGA